MAEMKNWLCYNADAYAIMAPHPTTEGHRVILPKNPAPSWDELPPHTQEAMWQLCPRLQNQIRISQAAHYSFDVFFDTVNGCIGLHLVPHLRSAEAIVLAEDIIHSPDQYSYPRLCTGQPNHPLGPSVHHLIQRADLCFICTAFIQDSGLRNLQNDILDALHRGATVKILCSDYLHITQAAALVRLLDWQDLSLLQNGSGSLQIKIAHSETRSWHVKAWYFQLPSQHYAYIGSSNLSYSALYSGVEWNLLVDDAPTLATVDEALQALWDAASPLTRAWLKDYVQSAQSSPQSPLPPGELSVEAPQPKPTAIQAKALESIEASRAQGYTAGLVVMATGLGKTYLAAFDLQRFPMGTRVLFVAHRRELLFQTATHFRRFFPFASFGYMLGDRFETAAQFCFASIQKLNQDALYTQLDPKRFDVIIIDEVHHAAAQSYQCLLTHFQPQFTLGLTATPERSDAADITGLFQDNLIFRTDLREGIEAGYLVPFTYIGRKDPVDYNSIPWRHKRFDPSLLDQALCDNPRLDKMWSLWEEHPCQKTLIFCASVAHANAVAHFLQLKGQKAVAVHTGQRSAPRAKSLNQLALGQIDAICAVDILNEGIDIPAIDRIFMLRPTQSSIVFLQQLGRGLRLHPQKDRLLVIDLVGNHHSFIARLHHISTLKNPDGLTRTFQGKSFHVPLPDGCEIDLDLELIALLKEMLPKHENPSIAHFQQLCTLESTRPSLGTLFRLGLKPRHLYTALDKGKRNWLSFLDAYHHLSEREQLIYRHAPHWFDMLEHTPMSKSYKMVTVLAFLQSNALGASMDIGELTQICRRIFSEDPILKSDIPCAFTDFERFWLRWLGSAWKSEKDWLILEDGKIRLNLSLAPTLLPEAHRLTHEIVDYRIASYRKRQQIERRYPNMIGRILQEGAKILLQLPDHPSVPEGQILTRNAKGQRTQLNIENGIIQSAHVDGKPKNQLKSFVQGFLHRPLKPYHDTRFILQLVEDEFIFSCFGERVPPLHERHMLPVYPTLAAMTQNTPHKEHSYPKVSLPLHDTHGHAFFAYQQPNAHLDRAPAPIQKGDWLICRWTHHDPIEQHLGGIVVVQFDSEFYIGRIEQLAGHALLHHTPNQPPLSIALDQPVIARVFQHVPLDQIAPPTGHSFPPDHIALEFGISDSPSPEHPIIDGHSFLFLHDDSLRPNPHPPTAYTLVEDPDTHNLIYLGLATRDHSTWQLPEAPQHLLKTVEATQSRPLPDAYQTAARTFIQNLPQKWIRNSLRKCRLRGVNKAGSIRFDGGTSGFAERTLSINDIGWALLAQAVAAASQAPFEPELILAARYPFGSTLRSAPHQKAIWAHHIVSKGHIPPAPESAFKKKYPKYKRLSKAPFLLMTHQNHHVVIEPCFEFGCPKHYRPPPIEAERWNSWVRWNRARLDTWLQNDFAEQQIHRCFACRPSIS